jgi:hypothetical protein
MISHLHFFLKANSTDPHQDKSEKDDFESSAFVTD